jgi:hypothetical protein
MTNSSKKDNVHMALSALRQTLDDEKERLNEEATQAMKDGEYDTATAVIQFTKSLLGFQDEVEVLIGKWEELEGVSDFAPQVRQAVGTRIIQSKPPSRLHQKEKTSNKVITQSTDYCFHILDILEEMGGAVQYQDVSTAVNKRVKMLYPKFKEARTLLAQRGWTKKNAAIHTLEISSNGSRWLQNQKILPTEDRLGECPSPSSRSENMRVSPLIVMPGNSVHKTAATASDDEDFDQI